MSVTAIVVARAPYSRPIPGCEVLAVYPGQIATAARWQAVVLAAVGAVETEHLCFINDDDELPVDFGDVLAECLDARAALAYTDEVFRHPDRDELRRGEPYSQDAHLRNMGLVHHLAVCETAAAQAAAATIPRGTYWPEMQLYWQLAKCGAAYIPRVGYIWHVDADGLHAIPSMTIAQARAAQWCAENR